MQAIRNSLHLCYVEQERIQQSALIGEPKIARPPFKPRREPPPNINGRLLRIPTLRVIDADGNQIGVMSSREALQKAQEQSLDLILVAENATPPVCKIADYGKMKYLEAKRKKETQKKAQDVKGLKISPRISDHDLHTIANKAHEFLTDGDKVRITCQFRNREITHPEIGKARLEKLVEQLDEVGIVEAPPALEGRLMVMVLRPKTA